MFKNIRKVDYLITIFIVLLVIILSYYYVNPLAREKLNRGLYPVLAFFEKKRITCSQDSPFWLRNIIKDLIDNNYATNNQIAYISSTGYLFHCESGYLGVPFFSDKVNENTRFRYASVSKIWTSDAVLDLVKNKKIDLNTPILRILNNILEPKDQRLKKITVEHLLLHKAGFNRVSILGDEMFRVGHKPFCPNDLNKLSKVKLSYVPGTTYNYSNLGYCLLGEIISKQTVNNDYKKFMDVKYGLSNDNILFLENKRFDDEAKYYYVESSLTTVGDIYTAFDYPSLASSAGLTGSAISLSKQVKQMITKGQPNILTMPNTHCNLAKLRDCYGYAMFPYRENKENILVYFRDGDLLGVTSLVVVDEKGGILSLLSGGQSPNGLEGNDAIKMKIYKYLNQLYGTY